MKRREMGMEMAEVALQISNGNRVIPEFLLAKSRSIPPASDPNLIKTFPKGLIKARNKWRGVIEKENEV